MTVLVNGDTDILAVCKKNYINKKCEENLKRSEFCIEVQTDNGYLIFSLLTCRLIYIQNKEYDSFWKSSEAYVNGYVCRDDFDEFDFVRNYRNAKRTVKKDISKFVVFTTTECNARCFYCFENGHKMHESLSDETAYGIIKYINDVTNGSIHLSWFGGEPLLNTKAIDIISKGCYESGKKFFSSIITNGYLINKEIVQRMVNDWNTKWVQITIDGAEEVYNKTKNYTNLVNDVSPYKIIFKNIRQLVDNNVFVLISLRVNCNNGSSLVELLEDIEKEFGNNRYLSIMCAAIHEKKQGQIIPRTDAEEKYIRSYQEKIMDLAFKKGLFKPRVPKELRVFHCNSDSGKELIILPNGKIGWCNNYLDSGYIGDIYNRKYDSNVIKKFEERYEEQIECSSCVLFPQCTRLKACDGSSFVCTKEHRKIAKKHIELAMRYEYMDYLSQHNLME